jgi:hypothetical protein
MGTTIQNIKGVERFFQAKAMSFDAKGMYSGSRLTRRLSDKQLSKIG